MLPAVALADSWFAVRREMRLDPMPAMREG
jgi:hypothetical protein